MIRVLIIPVDELQTIVADVISKVVYFDDFDQRNKLVTAIMATTIDKQIDGYTLGQSDDYARMYIGITLLEVLADIYPAIKAHFAGDTDGLTEPAIMQALYTALDKPEYIEINEYL